MIPDCASLPSNVSTDLKSVPAKIGHNANQKLSIVFDVLKRVKFILKTNLINLKFYGISKTYNPKINESTSKIKVNTFSI